MRLFKRMKDPVKGIAEVVAQMAPLCGGRGELRLIVTAEGVPPTSVEMTVSALNTKAIARWPMEHDTLPVTVDRANPQNCTIEWGEAESAEERYRRSDDEEVQKRLVEMGEEADATER